MLLEKTTYFIKICVFQVPHKFYSYHNQNHKYVHHWKEDFQSFQMISYLKKLIGSR